MANTDYNKQIVAYTDRLSVTAGDQQRFMVSSFHPGRFNASLVELICGDVRARGAGFQERHVASDLTGEYPVRHQPLVNGSYGVAEGIPFPASGSLLFHFFPTLLDSPGDQCLISLDPLSLVARNHVLRIIVDGAEFEAGRLHLRRWHSLVIEFGADSLRISLSIKALGIAERDVELVREFEGLRISARTSELVLAARRVGSTQTDCFNGKLESVKLTQDGQPVADWQFELDVHNNRFVDASSNGLHGRFYNHPIRATKGFHWDASTSNFQLRPEHYGAVHFHEDDLTDAGWEPTLSWTVPDGLPSGQYALKLNQGDDVDYVPFFVRPAPHHQRSRCAYLASTATYLAYANQRLFLAGAFASRVQNENDAFTRDHIEVGLSLYEHHTDGSGVHYSSYLRPILNLKPRGTMWSFNADTNVTAWLHHLDEPFDVITDEDLHREGESLLRHYHVVVTGTHPEYYSAPMLDGVESYLGNGGRLMYMGGNGFYWKIAYDPNNSAIIEVRRAEGGTRAWAAEAGDYYQSFDGQQGGLWRRNGRPPNQLVGIGFTAQGFDGGTHYRLTEAASDPRADFIFAGTSGNEIIGNYGSVEGGAAGQEIDRWDPELGSPTHALVLASSEQHKPGMLRAVEETNMSTMFMQGSKVRADMTFFETPSGGAVFSTGSISFAGSLAHNGYQNDICQVATNVFRRFSDPAPFEFDTTSEP